MLDQLELFVGTVTDKGLQSRIVERLQKDIGRLQASGLLTSGRDNGLAVLENGKTVGTIEMGQFLTMALLATAKELVEKNGCTAIDEATILSS